MNQLDARYELCNACAHILVWDRSHVKNGEGLTNQLQLNQGIQPSKVAALFLASIRDEDNE